ncbi:uncharacterized protein LOC134853126 [Symsagittifera roscoffensis]|uniref:uncharacterized protein LOC134853126 n=1 Tax=Symsagittifera roscoffensis TaxID=84072 RepID=UPI00307B53C4
MSRFPNVREHIMRNFTVYDPKKDLSRRRYNTLSEALKETGLPNNIKHKHLLTRKGEDGGDASSSGGGGIVSEGDIKEMFEKYDEIQMELMEKHLARDKKKKELRQSDSMRHTISSPRQRMGVCLRDAIGASADWPMDQTEVRDNYKSEEYERSRNQLPPPDEARRRRDSYSKWVGLNVLDQKHRQEWKEYLAETSQKPAV